MRLNIEIPSEIKAIKFKKKTGKNSGVLELDLATPGELICDTSKRPRGRI